MITSRRYTVLLGVTVSAYFIVSKLVFDNVYRTTHTVIDEQFHIPQGLAYCNGNYTHWDPKITTLPGLYIVSSAFLGFYLECNIYNLRFINLVASCVNLVLFASILKYVYGSRNTPGKLVLQALNLTLLPPLYFFSHVYYTDTLSLTFLLAFCWLCLNKYNVFSFILGFCSVMMRQTNVVWIAMVFGHKALESIIISSRVYGNRYLNRFLTSRIAMMTKELDTFELKRYYSTRDLIVALRYHASTGFNRVLDHASTDDFLMLVTQGTLLAMFMGFVVLNGSIVLGDKGAHEAAVHLPQLLYFLVFYGVFGLPHAVARAPSTLRLVARTKRTFVALCALCALVVHFNTVVHPYLVADNRHYTFYLWNRWYGRYRGASLATVPLYVLMLYSLYENLRDQNCVSLLAPCSACSVAALAAHQMIEVRYFLVPYIILRLRFPCISYRTALFEFFWYLFLNCVTFHLFFTKEIFWNDFDYAQRLIW